MFQLSTQDIHLAAQADNKNAAITQVAAALTQAGCVTAAYVDGMLAREQQTSTYLGNGIAIPHGTTDTRDQVLNTGVQVFNSHKALSGARTKLLILLSASLPVLMNIWRYCVS